MKVTKEMEKNDTRKAQQRYMDQPGQWVDTTPKAVKERRDKELKALGESLKKQGTKGTKKK
ncbi:MAG: hypothetical protein IJW67_13560 [Blautia sp.]|nr:hypothetical protein [Blautia sp.]